MDNKLTKLDSKAALHKYLTDGGLSYLVLGSGSEAPREFYAVDFPGPRTFRIGLIANGSGIQPSFFYSSNKQYWVIGFDARIGIVDTNAMRSIAEIPLDGVFFEFAVCDSEDGFVAVHELGAVKLSFLGARKWSISTDILESWRIESDDKLTLRQQDGKEIVADLNSGKLFA